jgi:hypothetical protein
MFPFMGGMWKSVRKRVMMPLRDACKPGVRGSGTRGQTGILHRHRRAYPTGEGQPFPPYVRAQVCNHFCSVGVNETVPI